MNQRVLLQPAWVIHRRPFRNTSLLVDLFCRDHGRVAAVARGARRGKSRWQGLLQPFQPLRVSFSGRGAVKTLTAAESADAPITMAGERLFSGFYINELLSHLLHDHVEHPRLHQVYEETLAALASRDSPLEATLRRFELELLAELGYALNLRTDCRHQAIEANKQYRYLPDAGFEEAEHDPDGYPEPELPPDDQSAPQAEIAASENQRIFAGTHLLAIARLDFGHPQTAPAAKRLLRQALAPHLAGKPLNSRALFAAAKAPHSR